MKTFIDSSVFIWALTTPQSNSSKIVELLTEGKLKASINELVLEEVTNYLVNYNSENKVYKTQQLLSTSCKVIPRSEIQVEMKKCAGKIKEKDLEHLATAKHLKVDYIIAFDRDYEPFPEYVTPKQFVKIIGLKASETEY